MISAILLGVQSVIYVPSSNYSCWTGLAHGLIPQLFFRMRNTRLVYMPVQTIMTIMIVIALLRGILHYLEQYCNHYIAFRLLAIIRHKVFEALQKLCPAKLESRDKGNLISIITTDIELLEVFYAHTISPIAIAFSDFFIYGPLYWTLSLPGRLTCINGLYCSRCHYSYYQW